jgi:NCS2 family nucleobase:cation symporter-2
MYSTGFCSTQVLEDGTIDYLPCPRAWGAILGTGKKKK